MGDLSSTLLIVPCCSSKKGCRDPDLSIIRVADLLSADMVERLEEGRRLSLARTHVDLGSPLRPALATYTGYPYATPGFRDLLVTHLRQGLHCLIISGGYGLLRPEEPIHTYQAHLQRTHSVWNRRIPELLRDYVRRNGIQRTFGVFTRSYASVVPDDLTNRDWRAVQTFDPERDQGAAMRAVPQKVGTVLVELMSADYQAVSANASAGTSGSSGSDIAGV